MGPPTAGLTQGPEAMAASIWAEVGGVVESRSIPVAKTCHGGSPLSNVLPSIDKSASKPCCTPSSLQAAI